MIKSSFLVGLAIPLVTAVPQYTPDMMGYTFYCPVIDSIETVKGDPWQTGASCAGGSEIQITKGHTVGTTWQVGGGIGLSVGDIIGLDSGLSGSVSETVEDSAEEAVTYECPAGDWHCSLMVYPGAKRVKGHMEKVSDKECPSGTKSNYENVSDGDKYELTIPKKADDGIGSFEAVICTCKNVAHWADAGHPQEFCKEDCALTG